MTGLVLLGCILGVSAAAGAVSFGVVAVTYAFTAVRQCRRGL